VSFVLNLRIPLETFAWVVLTHVLTQLPCRSGEVESVLSCADVAGNLSLLLDQLQDLAIFRHGESVPTSLPTRVEIAHVVVGYRCALFLKPILNKPMPVVRELIEASERMVKMIDDVLAFFRARSDAAFDDIPEKMTAGVLDTVSAFAGTFSGRAGGLEDLWSLLLEPLISGGDRSLLSDGMEPQEPEYYL